MLAMVGVLALKKYVYFSSRHASVHRLSMYMYIETQMKIVAAAQQQKTASKVSSPLKNSDEGSVD